MEILKLYIDEIDGLRRETDWCLQIAYAGPTAYVSSLFVALGLALNTLQGSGNFTRNVEVGLLAAIAFVLGNAMFIAVFAGNHFIEKKIEM